MGGLLIVDDQDIVRKGIKKMLKDMNLPLKPIYEASDGIEALSIAKEYHPDIILADIMMPNLDGLKFIECLRDVDITSHIIIISAYDEFNYAQKAIKFKVDGYILKPLSQKELYQVLISVINTMIKENEYKEKADEQIRQYNYMLLYELISGKDVLIQADKLFESTGMSLLKKQYFKIAIYESEYSKIEDLENEKNILDARLNKKEFSFISFYNGSKKILYILNFDRYEEDKIEPEIKDSLNLLNRAFICGVSGIKQGMASLTELYQQAEISLRESRFSGSKFYSFADANKKNARSVITIKECKEVLDCIEKGTMDELNNALDKIFIKVSKEKLSLENTRTVMFSLLNYLYMSLNEKYKEIGSVDIVRNTLDNTENIFTIKTIVKNEVDLIIKFISENNLKENSNYIISFLTNYIDNNYQHELSLTYLANKLNMNYYYLSNLFTKKVGASFSDYLLKVRLENAKRLLLNGNDKVYEIALKVGFKDVKYFHKAFKKFFNTTTKELRGKYSPNIPIEDMEDERE